MKVYNFEQRSPEWHEVRKLKMTASNAACIAEAGQGLKTYAKNLCKEIFLKERKFFINENIQRGIDLEDKAIEMYSNQTGNIVRKVGFVEYNAFVGCSPDGFVTTNKLEDGLAEAKCPSDDVHFNLLLTDKIDKKYLWQMQMQMLICGREWCDYIAYNENHIENLYIKRIYADKEMQNKLKKGFVVGEKLIKETLTAYHKKFGIEDEKVLSLLDINQLEEKKEKSGFDKYKEILININSKEQFDNFCEENKAFIDGIKENKDKTDKIKEIYILYKNKENIYCKGELL